MTIKKKFECYFTEKLEKGKWYLYRPYWEEIHREVMENLREE